MSKPITARVYDHEGWNIGDKGILVVYSPQQGSAKRWLQADAPRTNLSREPRLEGWCGTTDNVSCDAYGWHRVTEVLGFAPDDEMVLLVRLERVAA